MRWRDESKPTLAEFKLFLRNICGFGTDVLPDNSPVIPYALALAKRIVLCEARAAGCLIYDTMIFNLAACFIVLFAKDAPDQNPPDFWKNLRGGFGLGGFRAGPVASASNNGTSTGYAVVDSVKNLGIGDLQIAQIVPWGTTYLGFAAAFGTETWGLS